VAMVTVMAIIHGLIATRGLGRLKAAAVGVSVSLMGYSCLDANATVRSHTITQGATKDYSVAIFWQATASEGFSARCRTIRRQASTAAIDFPFGGPRRILVQESPVLVRSCE
jgi:hypothetical protein